MYKSANGRKIVGEVLLSTSFRPRYIAYFSHASRGVKKAVVFKVSHRNSGYSARYTLDLSQLM